MPLTPQQMRRNLTRRFAETFEQDERAAATLRAKLPEAVRLIREACGDRRIVLFGSLARGLFLAEHSDVDLAVEGIGAEPPAGLRSRLRDLLGRRVDMVDPGWVAERVRRRIEREGQVLHEPRREGR